MFVDHFGLREQPFGVTPDPHFLYFSPSHLEALASLFYGIQTKRGFMALIAKPGMGKTTLLFHLLEHLRDSARTAFLFQAHSNTREFLRSLLADLGVNDEDDDPVHILRKLNEVLIRELSAGRRVVVVIDEAQNLEDSVLETVRMLSNFEVPGTKLIQILVAGQPQLADKLAGRNLVQLRQRISILSHLTQFSASETADYIDHRLRVAGYQGKPLFTADALALIHSRSEGIPRNINNLCFHASTLAFANGQEIIDASILSEVLEDLDVEMLGSGTANKEAVPQQDNGGRNVDPAHNASLVNQKWLGHTSISANIELDFKTSAEGNVHDERAKEKSSKGKYGLWSPVN